MAILVFTVPIPAFPVPPLVLPSTKSRFLCAFCLRDPHFRAFQAQKSTFCTILPSRTPDFRLFEHKIEVFVRFWGLEPLFSGFSSTKSPFLCSRSRESSIGKPKNKRIHLDIIPDGDLLAKRQPHPASNICAPARRQPHPAEIRRWRRQSVQMGRQICVCLSSCQCLQQRRMRTYIIRCGKGRIPMLRVSKSGPGALDC